MNSEIKIYVACLASYNSGYLHGRWIDATQAPDDIQSQIQDMLACSPLKRKGEEYAIHDHEGFAGYQLSEYEGIEATHKIACFIAEYGEFGAELLNYFGGYLEDATTAMEDHYYGCYESLADYARELTEQTSEIPKHLEFYIDYERMVRDWDLSGDIFTVQTAHDEVHVFSNL